MTSFKHEDAIKVLEEKLPHTTDEECKYLEEAKARLLGRTSDDNKEATKLAVETAKMLLTIAIAVLVAVGAFVQFALKESGIDWDLRSIILFALTGALLLASMREGLAVISSAYKRAGGAEAANETAWSVAPLRNGLGLQALLGLAALLLLIGSLVSAAYEAKLAPSVSMTSSPLVIEGQWTELRLITRQAKDRRFPLGATPITLTCK